MEEWLSTNEVAKRLGVGGTSVKRWAQQGILRCHHTAGGHRRFSVEHVERFLRDKSDSREGLNPEIDAWVELLISNDSVHRVHERLLVTRSKYSSWCEVVDLELGPVVGEIGSRWSAGNLTIAQEHVASAKLFRALGLCAANLPGSASRVCLLATAASDVHTLGLSFFEVCVREQGFQTRWLGERMPTSELVRVINFSESHVVGMSASAYSDDADTLASEVFQVLSACRSKGIPLLLGGAGAWPNSVPGATRLNTLSDLNVALERYFPGR